MDSNVHKAPLIVARAVWMMILTSLLGTLAGAYFLLLPANSALAVKDDTATILITGTKHPSGFLPDLITVHVRQRVVFVNQSDPPASYQVVADNHAFSSPSIAPDQQWSVSLNAAGIFEYHDPSRPNMVGELIVVSASTSLLPPPDLKAEATALAALNSQQSLSRSTTMQMAEFPIPLLIIGGIIAAIFIVFISLVIILRR